MPEGTDAPRIEKPRRHAAGLGAVRSALDHAHHELGVWRGLTSLLRMNQMDGFDCPGCAWPDPADRNRLEFCENGAKALAEEATRRRVERTFFARHSVADLSRWSDFDLGQQGRLTEPMVLRPGGTHYEPIAWNDVFDLIAGELRALDSADEAVFYTSGRTSNEAAFLYQLFVRRFGTNNLPDCSNMCHESSGVALSQTIGSGKGTVTLEDLHHSDLIFVVGQNPGTNHPRMLAALERAKERGARIIAVNPLPEAGLIRFKNPQRPAGLVGRGTTLADLFLQIRLNGDLALFQMLNRLLLDEEDRRPGAALDHDFIARHCQGFDEMARHLRALDPAVVRVATGLGDDQICEALRMVLGARRIIVCWAMGLTQHRNAVATICEVVNFLLLRGNIGRRGAGACPVRGHSNVQGDRTMGIHERPDPDFLDALENEFAFRPPRHQGYDTIESIRAMRAGRVAVFVGLGGNFVAAAPDTEVTAAAMQRCRLTVHVSTKLNRSHTVTGATALILPCLARTEIDAQDAGAQFVTVEDAMGVVHASRGHLRPASEQLKSEVAIVCGIARATLPPSPVLDWTAFENDYRIVRAHISRVVMGFENFEARVQVPGGFPLPHPARDERRFPTAVGKARFSVNRLEVVDLPEGRLLLQTIRSHDQYNTTIYGLDDRYRGVHGGRRVLFAHPEDLALLGFADGQVVDLESEPSDGRCRRAPGYRLIAYPVARGTCAAYFPEANTLVPLDATAEESRTPTSKSIVVRLLTPSL